MDKQTLFDAAATGLIAQGEKALSEEACRYRAVGSKGKIVKCAIGQLIPDELYMPSLEGCLASALPSNILAALGCNKPNERIWLDQLQFNLHDNPNIKGTAEGFKAAAVAFARGNGLNAEAIDAL